MGNKRLKKFVFAFFCLLFLLGSGLCAFAQETAAVSDSSVVPDAPPPAEPSAETQSESATVPAQPPAAAASDAEYEQDGELVKNFSLHVNEAGETYFMQRFTWQEIPYSRRYIVNFEQMDENGDFVPLGDPIETTVNELSLSFTPGLYRYSVQVVNLLGKTQLLSDMREFEVLQAYQPEILAVAPENIFLEYPQTGIFTLQGINIFDRTTITLESESKTVDPLQVTLSGEETIDATVVFPVQALTPGQYVMKATDPSGLAATYPVGIRYLKPVDFLLSVSYRPIFILGDDTFKDAFGGTMSILGAELSATLVFFKRPAQTLALSARLSYNPFSGEQEYYESSANIFQGFLDLDFLFFFLRRQLILDVYIGAGAFHFYDLKFSYRHDLESDSYSSWSVAANGGFSLLYFFTENRHLYMQLGCEVFYTTYDHDIMFVGVAPRLGVGWQF